MSLAAPSMVARRLRVLVEMRPALDGHSGIPQETRLLFCGLAGLPEVEVIGLLQSGNLLMAPGLPMGADGVAGDLPAERRVDLLSRVLVSLQQHPRIGRIEHARRMLKFGWRACTWFLSGLFGRSVRLTFFDPAKFEDFIWRSLFAKSLPPADLPTVTTRPFWLVDAPWSLSHRVGVAASAWGHAVYPRLRTKGVAVMIAETPFPGRVERGTTLVVRYHDSIPLLMPHTIKNMGLHRAAHYEALKRNVRDGAWFACVSESTRLDLLAVFPQLQQRAVTIPNMVSHHFHPETEGPGRVPEVVWARKNRGAPFAGGAPVVLGEDGSFTYLLMVATVEPRKNHLMLLEAWERLRSHGFPHLNLVLVGSLGWGHDGIEQRFAPWLERGGLHLLEGVPSDDLRLLYRHAAVTVCPSLGEGFDFPGVEAMRSGGVVAASDIPVHRDVFDDACAYFGAYAAQELAAVVTRLMQPEAEGERQGLRARGLAVAERYLPEHVIPQWQRFLRELSLVR